MTVLRAFAKALGIAPTDAEDALHSERGARAVLSRRAALQSIAIGAAALATFKSTSFGGLPWSNTLHIEFPNGCLFDLNGIYIDQPNGQRDHFTGTPNDKPPLFFAPGDSLTLTIKGGDVMPLLLETQRVYGGRLI